MAKVTIQDRIHCPYPQLPLHVHRVPPRKEVEISVKVDDQPYNTVGPSSPVVLKVVDSHTGTGEFATLNGEPELQLDRAQVHKVKIQGVTQTQGGRKVVLVASQNEQELARSNEFYICAYPTNMSVKPFWIKQGTSSSGGKYGLKVVNKVQSDSGELRDLDEVQISEKVKYTHSTGALAHPDPINSSYRPATAPVTDFHSSPSLKLVGLNDRRSPGSVTAEQMFVFKCTRSQVNNIPVAKSGFVITKTARVVDSSGKEIEPQEVKTGDPSYKVRLIVEEKSQDVEIGSMTEAGRLEKSPLLAEHLLPHT